MARRRGRRFIERVKQNRTARAADHDDEDGPDRLDDPPLEEQVPPAAEEIDAPLDDSEATASLGDAKRGEASSREVSAAAYVTPAVRGAAAWAWRLAIIAIVGTGVVWALMQLSLVVVPVLVAALLTSLLNPIVMWLNRNVGLPRALAAALTMLVTFGAVALLLTL